MISFVRPGRQRGGPLCRLLLLAVVAASPACKGDKGSGGGDQPVTDKGATSGQTAGASQTSSDSGLRAHMREHFAAIVEIQKAVVDGAHERAADHAGWLADHTPHDAVEAWTTHLERVQSRARELSEAQTFAAAAELAAQLASECGNCHTAQSVTPSFALVAAPQDTQELADRMKLHEWAVARLWEGIVGPSDDLWQQGARALASVRIEPAEIPGGEKLVDQITPLRDRLIELAEMAAAAATHDERAAVYGQLLTTCSACHLLARPEP